MKKNFFILLTVLMSAVVMTGCGLWGLAKTGATVNIKVVNLVGTPQSGEMVYKYSGDATDTELANKSMADAYVATDQDGIAEFSIMNAELLLDDQATFYFETFDKDGKVSGRKAVQIKKGHEVTETITIGQLF